MSAMTDRITFDDFLKVGIRLGTVIDVVQRCARTRDPEARPIFRIPGMRWAPHRLSGQLSAPQR